MQEIVQERLPKFTPDEVALVKGSSDYIGINQYTAYYMKGKKIQKNDAPSSYGADWQIEWICE